MNEENGSGGTSLDSAAKSAHAKNIALAIIVALVVIAIWWIEVHKPPTVTGQSVALTSATSTPTAGAISTTTSSAIANSSQSSAQIAAFEASRAATLKQEAAEYPPAVEIIPGGDSSATGMTPYGAPASSGFINTAPFTLKSLIGQKVVLIDFWTYSCINCLRTLPYLEAWNAKYASYGLEIVGIHTPEFDFEKSYSNVLAATERLGVTYPVVQDNNMATWNAYNNEYWPNEFLINIDGYIVHNQIGEGDYDKSEEAIQAALQERAQVLGVAAGESAAQIAADVAAIPTGLVNPSNAISMIGGEIASPETYFGSARNEFFGNGTQGATGVQTLTVPADADAGATFMPSAIQPNMFYLGGTWNIQPQYAESVAQPAQSSGEKIIYQYDAKNVYFVASADPASNSASSSQGGVKVTVLLDGKPIPASVAGADVAPDGTMTIQANRLYSVVNGASYGMHTLELDVQGAGLDAYTFTFG